MSAASSVSHTLIGNEEETELKGFGKGSSIEIDRRVEILFSPCILLSVVNGGLEA